MDTGESPKQPLKPLRREGRVAPVEPVVDLLVCFFQLHARLRVRPAPGFPCALCSFEGQCELQNSSGCAAARAAKLRLKSDRMVHCERNEASSAAREPLDCFGTRSPQ